MNSQFSFNEQGTCMLGDMPLHPHDDPAGVARAELSGFTRDTRVGDVLVMVGGGAGWHLREVANHAPTPRVVIYEPDMDRWRFTMEQAPEAAQFPVAHDPESLMEALGELCVYGSYSRVGVFCPFAYYISEPELSKQARKVAHEITVRRSINQGTINTLTQQWAGHLVENAPAIMRHPEISRLVNVFQGLPAVVVGAGPSLNRSLPALGQASRKALVLAAASALGPMDQAGQTPHLTLSLEAKDESRQFVGRNLERTLLVMGANAHPNHHRNWPGHLAFCHPLLWTARLFGAQVLPTGGHATSALFSLAILLGCDPVIMVGQDLAYTEGRIHAQGRPGGEDEETPLLEDVPAIGGGTVPTSPVYRSYISWYQETAAYLRRAHPERRVINATAAGAQLSGFAHQPLDEILAQLPDLGEDLGQLPGQMARTPAPSRSLVAQSLSLARREVRVALNQVPDQDWRELVGAVPDGSPVKAALGALSLESEPEVALESLERMMDFLRALDEGLHA